MHSNRSSARTTLRGAATLYVGRLCVAFLLVCLFVRSLLVSALQGAWTRSTCSCKPPAPLWLRGCVSGIVVCVSRFVCAVCASRPLYFILCPLRRSRVLRSCWLVTQPRRARWLCSCRSLRAFCCGCDLCCPLSPRRCWLSRIYCKAV